MKQITQATGKKSRNKRSNTSKNPNKVGQFIVQQVPAAATYRAPESSTYQAPRSDDLIDYSSGYLRSIMYPDMYASKIPDGTIACTHLKQVGIKASLICGPGCVGVVWLPTLDSIYLIEDNGGSNVITTRVGMAEELKDSFSRVRLASGGFSLQSNAQSTTSNQVQGSISTIWAHQMPPSDQWTFEGLEKYAMNGVSLSTDTVENGIVTRYIPQGIQNFRVPWNKDVRPDVDIIKFTVPFGLFKTLGGAPDNKILLSVPKSSLPALALGRVEISGVLNYSTAPAVDKWLYCTVYRGKTSHELAALIPAGTKFFPIRFLDSEEGDVQKIEMNHSDSANAGVLHSATKIDVSMSDATQNSYSPMCISMWGGIAPGMQINLLGRLNYETIPDTALSAQIKGDYARPPEIERQMLIKWLESGAAPSVVKMREYSRPEAANWGALFKKVVGAIPSLANNIEKGLNLYRKYESL